MRIVLFGDIHLYDLKLMPWHLLSKRILGQTNLWINRRGRFDPALVEAMVEQIIDIDPQQIICPGDLTTTATHAEFRMARRALGDLFHRYPVFIVPGNHDRYTFKASRARRFEQYFGEYSPDHYPHLRTLADGLHLIAIDACRPNLLLDRGKVGRPQLADVKQMLQAIPAGEHVIVVCHYTPGVPPQRHEGRSHNLVDQDELVRTLAEADRDILYVHGHVHRPWCWRLDEAPKVVAINAGSPTHTGRTMPHGQGFWQLDFDSTQPQPWRLTHHRMHFPGQWHTTPIALPSVGGRGIDPA